MTPRRARIGSGSDRDPGRSTLRRSRRQAARRLCAAILGALLTCSALADGSIVSYDNLAPAKAMGMATVLIASNPETGEDWADAVDIHIPDILDLAGAIRPWVTGQ